MWQFSKSYYGVAYGDQLDKSSMYKEHFTEKYVKTLSGFTWNIIYITNNNCIIQRNLVAILYKTYVEKMLLGWE